MKKEKLLRAAIDCTAHRRSETKTAEHNSKLAENGHAIGTSSGTNSDHSALHMRLNMFPDSKRPANSSNTHLARARPHLLKPETDKNIQKKS